MAEAIGIAGVLGVIDVSLKAPKEIIRYSENAKNANKTIVLLKRKARSLEQQLKHAMKIIESDLIGDTQWFDYDAVKKSQQTLDNVKKKLLKISKRPGFIIALQQSKYEAALRAVRDHYDLVRDGILLKVHDANERHRLHEWFCNVDSSKRHDALKTNKEANTGLWLLQTNEFHSWLTSKVTSPLWVHGLPGSGKSMQASTIVETLSAHCNVRSYESLGFAYFYFDFGEVGYQDQQHGLVPSYAIGSQE